ncbi:TetR/AcrR family transcriptional regulator [Arthrobacter sp. TMN-37]
MNTSSTVSAVPPGTGAAPDGRSSRWEEHRAERRRALISTARRAVDTLGHGASMEDIAAAADTSKSVYYRYFGDKTGLQQAMAEVVTGQMQQKILTAARQAQTPREGLRAMISVYLQMAQTSPNVYAFVTRVGAADSGPGGADDARPADPLTHFLEAVTEMLARPMRAYLRSSPQLSGPADPRLVYWPRAAIGMVRSAGELWLAMPAGPEKPGVEQLADQLTDWLFEGISHQVPTGRTPGLAPDSTTSSPAKDNS